MTSDQMDVIKEENEVTEVAMQNMNDFEDKKVEEVGLSSTKD